MLKRTLMPVLLAGLLSIGCANAQAQEGERERAERDRAEQLDRERADKLAQEKRLDELRSELARARTDLSDREAHLAEARRATDRLKQAIVKREAAMDSRAAALSDEARELENALDKLRREGRGDAHPEMQELTSKLERLETARAEFEASAKEMHVEMRHREVDLDRAANEVQTVRRHVAELHAHLERMQPGAPLPGRTGDARGPGPRSGRQGPRRARGERGERGGSNMNERMERLEHTVEELRRMLDQHGFSAERRERAMAEMQRRERDHRVRDGRRGAEPRRSRGEFGEVDRGRGIGGGMRGEGGRRRPPPPEAGGRREADELRRELQRARTENEDLRKIVQSMRDEMANMRAEFERHRQKLKSEQGAK